MMPPNPRIERAKRPFTLTSVLALLLGAFGSPTHAQDGVGSASENVQNRSYGSGWNCNVGFRLEDGAFVGIDLPEN